MAQLHSCNRELFFSWVVGAPVIAVTQLLLSWLILNFPSFYVVCLAVV